jgi:hypothetical protein
MAQQQEREVWYEPHPVTPERKKALLDAHYKIVDARYAPPGWVRPGAPTDWVSPKREIDNEPGFRQQVTVAIEGLTLGAEEEKALEPFEFESVTGTPTSAELRAKLDAAGIEYQKHAPKAKLLELAAGL